MEDFESDLKKQSLEVASDISNSVSMQAPEDAIVAGRVDESPAPAIAAGTPVDVPVATEPSPLTEVQA